MLLQPALALRSSQTTAPSFALGFFFASIVCACRFICKWGAALRDAWGGEAPQHLALNNGFYYYLFLRRSQYQAKGLRLSASFASCWLIAIIRSLSSLKSSPLGAISTFPLIRHPFHVGQIGVRSSPLWIIISFLHSGGLGLPASQLVIVLTVLQQSSAVSSLDNPHVNHLKISLSCIFRLITLNPS